MRSRILGIVALAFVIGLACLSAYVVDTGNAQVSEGLVRPAPTVTKEKSADDEASPIVDYDYVASFESPQQERIRKDKNARYDKRGFVKSNFDEEAREVVRFSHWQTDLSALPADKSEVVIIGEVLNSSSFLSNDRTGIYSEYTIRVAEVLKQSYLFPTVVGKVITAQREGGRVRYGSGRIIRFLVAGQGAPARNRTYAFFLKSLGKGDYEILTAYELASGKVVPLDGSITDAAGQGNWVFDKMNGFIVDDFLLELRQVREVQG